MHHALLSLLAALAFVLPSIASAQPQLKSLIADLGGTDRAKTQTAIEALGTRSDATALSVLEALEEKRLRVSDDGRAFIKDAQGSATDALTGESVELPDDAKMPLLTNTLRRALSSSLAQLRLRSKDGAVRLRAAEVVARSPAPEMIGTLRDALSREDDRRVKQQLSLAVARIDLESDNRTLRLAAVKTIADQAEITLKPELERMLVQDEGGRFAEPDDDVRKAARKALNAIERKEFFVRIARDLFYGVSLGSVLLLAALGLAITFGLMGVINMAHGEMLMLGAYSTFVVQNFFQANMPSAVDWYLVAAVPVAFMVCFAIGVLLERLVIRFLYGRPLETLLATWGISLGLIQTVRLIFGAQNVTVANPSWLSGGWELVTGVVLPYTRLATILFVVVVVSFVWYLLNQTRLGLNVRAITQNRRMARCMGIPAARIDMLTFGIGSGVAGLGGVALSQIGNVGPELGQAYIVDSFMVVVLGGVGKVIGTVVAALGLGTVTKVLEPLSGAVLGKIFVLGFIILFIQRRPQGLFAVKGRAAEM